MSYVDQLNKARKSRAGKSALEGVSSGEIGWDIAGGAGGALLGYALAKLLHNRPSTRTKLLYTLGGAGAGASAAHTVLKKLPGTDGFNGSLADEMRLHGLVNHDVAPDIPATDRKLFSAPNKSTLIAAGAGGVLGGMNTRLSPVNIVDWATEGNLGIGESSRRAVKNMLQEQIIAGGVNNTKVLKDALEKGRRLGWDVNVDPSNLNAVTVDYRPAGALTLRTAGALSGAALLGLAAYALQVAGNNSANNASISKEQLLGGFGKKSK